MVLKGGIHIRSYFLLLGLTIFLLGSCSSPKKISYFNYIPDSLRKDPMALQLAQYADPKIQANDVLQISVQTIDPAATSMMGTQPTPATGSPNTQTPAGYMVDKDGFIELPLAGRIKVGGMTTSEARDAIAQKASQFYKNPVVNVRFANFTITVLGEVAKAGQITVPAEKIGIFDAIGLAGDVRVTGNKDDILLMREENGEKKFVRLSLNDPTLFQSPYYYLRQHDVLYVQPNKNAAAAADTRTARALSFVSVGLTVLNLVAIILTRF